MERVHLRLYEESTTPSLARDRHRRPARDRHPARCRVWTAVALALVVTIMAGACAGRSERVATERSGVDSTPVADGGDSGGTRVDSGVGDSTLPDETGRSEPGEPGSAGGSPGSGDGSPPYGGVVSTYVPPNSAPDTSPPISYKPVEPRGGTVGAQPVRIESWSHRGTLLELRWVSGVEPCHVLDRIHWSLKGDTIEVAVLEGADPSTQSRGAACIEVAQYKSATVDVGASPAGCRVVDLSTKSEVPLAGDAPSSGADLDSLCR